MSTSPGEATAFVPGLLTDHDRCDRCGSRAYVEVTLPQGKLAFCGHHYQEFEARLRPVATAVLDERDRLHAAASPGSAYTSSSA